MALQFSSSVSAGDCFGFRIPPPVFLFLLFPPFFLLAGFDEPCYVPLAHFQTQPRNLRIDVEGLNIFLITAGIETKMMPSGISG